MKVIAFPTPLSPMRLNRPLRVVQVIDSRQTSRLRISGRLADVCAELDRLAAREARSAA